MLVPRNPWLGSEAAVAGPVVKGLWGEVCLCPQWFAWGLGLVASNWRLAAHPAGCRRHHTAGWPRVSLDGGASLPFQALAPTPIAPGNVIRKSRQRGSGRKGSTLPSRLPLPRHDAALTSAGNQHSLPWDSAAAYSPVGQAVGHRLVLRRQYSEVCLGCALRVALVWRASYGRYTSVAMHKVGGGVGDLQRCLTVMWRPSPPADAMTKQLPFASAFAASGGHNPTAAPTDKHQGLQGLSILFIQLVSAYQTTIQSCTRILPSHDAVAARFAPQRAVQPATASRRDALQPVVFGRTADQRYTAPVRLQARPLGRQPTCDFSYRLKRSALCRGCSRRLYHQELTAARTQGGRPAAGEPWRPAPIAPLCRRAPQLGSHGRKGPQAPGPAAARRWRHSRCSSGCSGTAMPVDAVH